MILVTKLEYYYDNSANYGAGKNHCEQLSKSPNLTFFERIRPNINFIGGGESDGFAVICKNIT
ncbi:hypothetical protein D3C77_584900 [compost metagenome]